MAGLLGAPRAMTFIKLPTTLMELVLFEQARLRARARARVRARVRVRVRVRVRWHAALSKAEA